MGKYTKVVITEYEYKKLKKQLSESLSVRSTKVVQAIYFTALKRIMGLNEEDFIKINAEVESISLKLHNGEMTVEDMQKELAEVGVEYEYD